MCIRDRCHQGQRAGRRRRARVHGGAAGQDAGRPAGGLRRVFCVEADGLGSSDRPSWHGGSLMPPVFAHGQLRLYLLALLESGAKHGYELITALSDRFGGTYRPSPGTIYPRLARLEEEGLVRRTEDGRKTTYALTDAGRRELDVRQAAHGLREVLLD